MKNIISYIIYACIVLTAVSCTDEIDGLENELIGHNTVCFSAKSSRLLTRSGLTYTYFDTYTNYLLFGVESSANYDWSKAVMYDRQAYEDDQHFIEYGKDLFFDGKELDFYGATLCSTRGYPDNVNTPAAADGTPGDPVIDLTLEKYGNVFPDLMYSRNLKKCTAKMGILEMNFTHALSKIQIEVSKQNDSEDLKDSYIKELSIVNTSSGGDLDIQTGRWTVDDTATEIPFFNGNVEVTTDPTMIKNGNKDAELLIIPNETSKQVVSLKIILSTAKSGEKTITYPLYTDPETGETTSNNSFIFEQNHRYVLSIILLNDGVRVIAVAPQAYEWIDVPLEPYMGQPVNFGGLMWMDRNLGATSADCENDWANTRGFYYQYGRNIPYIFDHEKFLNRNKSEKAEFRDKGDGSIILDVGYEYFFTYNDKGERVYGAVQGGTRNGHYFYHVDTLNVSGQTIGWVNNGGWVWKGSRLTNYRHEAAPHYASTNGGFSAGKFWMVDQIGYNGTDSYTAWTEDNGAPRWNGPNVTVSNIAINPGDPGIYHFIFDARYYHDYLQSGAWCVTDCDGPDCWNWDAWRAMSLTEWNTGYPDWSTGTSDTHPTFKDWFLRGCWETRTEAVDAVNYFWADRNGKPLPDNHPCPKGWRIPTKEDFAGIIPDHTIEHTWATTNNTMYVVQETYGDVLSSYKEAVIYGIDHLGRKVIYIIKRKGENECYRLKLLWKDSKLTRNSYYDLETATSDYPMKYLEITRYPGSSEMNFDKYFNSSYGSIVTTNSTDASIAKTARKMTGDELNTLGFYTDYDWENSTEVMQIPICGFIYTTMGVDGMYADGDMTILRCTDWSENYDLMSELKNYYGSDVASPYSEGAYPYNEAMNWCCYVRTDRNTGLFSGSRKCLGDQIRCVRDVNAQ